MYRTPRPRSGTVLIIVAGIAGLLASLAVAFLAQLINDNERTTGCMRETQARIMLVAACSYIQEASRIGWDRRRPSGTVHAETYGWIDVRDGCLGPKPAMVDPALQTERNAIDALPSPDPAGAAVANFPIGVARRFPMYVMRRPPYAIQNRACYNPISQNPDDPDYLKPYLRYPDPQPAVDNGWRMDPRKPAGEVTAEHFAAWEQGDAVPRQESLGLSWFRIMREPSGAVFLITCGGGGSMGFRDWTEVARDPEGLAYFTNEASFEASRQGEVRTWYRVEWSPAVTAIDNHLIYHCDDSKDHYQQFPLSMSVITRFPWGQLFHHNMGGTISWIQRLREEPAQW